MTAKRRTAETVAAGFVFSDPPHPECHASTIARLPDDSLVCAWFGGTREKHPDVAIWLARKAPGADAFDTPRQVAKVAPDGETAVAHWNPVLFLAPDDSLHLWFKVGATIDAWKTWTCVSGDGGETFSPPRELVPGDETGGRGPVKNKPIRLENGDWLAGSSSEQGTWEAFVDRSTDSGKTWRRTPNFDRTALGAEHGVIQPALWESAPGHVHALLRTSCGVIVRADSTDNGETWSPIYKSDVPNNNSGIDAVRLENGVVALVCNPVAKNWGARSPLSLLLSTDNGATWTDAFTLEDEPGGEFSYPAIVAFEDRVFVSYTHRRTRIAWRELRLDP